ncbi:MAG: flagellin [Planctomycetota bacterium]
MLSVGRIGLTSMSLAQTQASTQRSFARIASGRRINSAADDAANLATVQQFLAIEASVGQGISNLADGAGLARTAEGALGSSADLLGRMRELSIQARNGTLNDQDRAAIQQEYDQLSAEVTRVAESTSFNGIKPLSGELAGAGIQLEDGTGSGAIEVSIEGQTAADLGIAGLNAAAAGTVQALDDAIHRVSAGRGKLGSVDNRIDVATRNLASIRENVAAARSRVGDADVGAEISNLIRNRTIDRLSLGAHLAERRGAGAVLDLFG